jgi:hypothetical protein
MARQGADFGHRSREEGMRSLYMGSFRFVFVLFACFSYCIFAFLICRFRMSLSPSFLTTATHPSFTWLSPMSSIEETWPKVRESGDFFNVCFYLVIRQSLFCSLHFMLQFTFYALLKFLIWDVIIILNDCYLFSLPRGHWLSASFVSSSAEKFRLVPKNTARGAPILI